MRSPPETEAAPIAKNKTAPPWLWALRILALLTTALATLLPIIAAFWLVVFLVAAAALFLYLITFGGIHFRLDQIDTTFARSAVLAFTVYLIVIGPVGYFLLKATARVAAWTLGISSTVLLGAWLLDHDLLALLGSAFPH